MNNKIAIFCGSFNPLHQGHVEIQKLAEEILGTTVYFELSIVNAYKPAIDFVDLKNRQKYLEKYNYLITKSPRFVDKINTLKSVFNPKQIIIVVGADTWERVYDAAAHKNGDIKFFENNNIKFLVFGRNSEIIKNQDSPLFLKSEIALNYSNSISSSELRRKN
jgi:nicotinic acid mononucleotide adenylyltransferase